MKEILKEYPAFLKLPEAKLRDKQGDSWVSRPKLPILQEVWIAYPGDLETRIQIKALLDTGCDITLINPVTVRALESRLKTKWKGRAEFAIPLSVEKKFKFWDSSLESDKPNLDIDPDTVFEPLYELVLFFTPEDVYSGEFGLLSPSSWIFDNGIDMWIGQDILRQLIVTFNDEKWVTIVDNNKS